MADTPATPLAMPKLGETMESGLVVDWLVKEGASYKRGEILLEIETDKTVAEVPALEDGTLVEILHKPGDQVAVGEPIATVKTAGKAAAPKAPPPAAAPAPAAASAKKAAPAPRKPATGGAVSATPAARKLAKKAGIALDGITGSGRNGRIEVEDVSQVLEAASKGAATKQPAAAAKPSEVRLAHDIAHVTIGDPSAAPVLLLHGFAGDHTTFSALGIALAKRGCFVVIPDLPGHGQTKLEASAVADLGVNLAALCTELFARRSLHVCAHSLGTAVALDLADKLELGSLTLIAPAQLGVVVDQDFVAGMASPKDRAHVAELLAKLTFELEALSPKAVDAIYAQQAKGRLRKLAATLASTEGAAGYRAKLAALAAKAPVSVLLGREDAILDWQAVAALELDPRIGLHLFAATGHTPQWEAFNETLEILRRQIGAG